MKMTIDGGEFEKCILTAKTEDIWDEKKGYQYYISVAEIGDIISNQLA